jgi:hypothetical protein
MLGKPCRNRLGIFAIGMCAERRAGDPEPALPAADWGGGAGPTARQVRSSVLAAAAFFLIDSTALFADAFAT